MDNDRTMIIEEGCFIEEIIHSHENMNIQEPSKRSIENERNMLLEGKKIIEDILHAHENINI